MKRIFQMELWSRRSDIRALLAFVMIAAVLAVGYFFVWPEYRWHFHTKPELLAMMEEVRDPQLEVFELSGIPDMPYTVEHHGLRVSSPIAIEATDRGIEAEGIQIFVSENFPGESTSTYVASFIGALSVQPENIRSASSSRERMLAEEALLARQILLGTMIINGNESPSRFDRAIIVASEHATVYYLSGPTICSGIIVNPDGTDRRDFILVLDGIDRDSVESIIDSMHLVE